METITPYYNMILMAIFASAVVPLALDLFWSTKVAIDNKRRGAPTYACGFAYGGLVWPSGYTFPDCRVTKTSYKTVTFSGGGRTVTVKKSLLASGKVMTLGLSPGNK